VGDLVTSGPDLRRRRRRGDVGDRGDVVPINAVTHAQQERGREQTDLRRGNRREERERQEIDEWDQGTPRSCCNSLR
jgi:hypothetical protein